MIYDLTVSVKKADQPHYAWAEKIDFLQKNPQLEFAPGLNILFGPNGSGKSTIAGILAFHLAAEQGGRSTVTQQWATELLNYQATPQTSWEVGHDGQPVLYINPRNAIGLVGGRAGFDDDFFHQGVINAMAKGSSGQTTLRRIEHLIATLMRDEAKPIDPVVAANAPRGPRTKTGATRKRKTPTDEGQATPPQFPSTIEWKAHLRPETRSQLEAHLAANRPAGPRTIILDEPESGLSLPFQAGLWHNVLSSKSAGNFQLIVATHSPFALTIPGANYLETQPGYLETCRALFRGWD